MSNDTIVAIATMEEIPLLKRLAFICAMGFRGVKAVKVVSDNLNYQEYEQTIGGGEYGIQ